MRRTASPDAFGTSQTRPRPARATTTDWPTRSRTVAPLSATVSARRCERIRPAGAVPPPGTAGMVTITAGEATAPPADATTGPGRAAGPDLDGSPAGPGGKPVAAEPVPQAVTPAAARPMTMPRATARARMFLGRRALAIGSITRTARDPLPGVTPCGKQPAGTISSIDARRQTPGARHRDQSQQVAAERSPGAPQHREVVRIQHRILQPLDQTGEQDPLRNRDAIGADDADPGIVGTRIATTA